MPKYFSKESVLKDPRIAMAEKLAIEKSLRLLNSAPASKGKSLLLKHFNGKPLTPIEMIEAKCCVCRVTGMYKDGRVDCEQYLCPLYPRMPYGQMVKRYIRKERRKKDPCKHEYRQTECSFMVDEYKCVKCGHTRTEL